jgi:hypothetical protein|uniref:Uncharacterized protein n=1 Tax=viral metagenome TaxID=1070528 RepID=A0A6C0KW03_9ZZZZ
MDKVIQNVLKIQNKALLERFAEDYNKDVAVILGKYHSPSFYAIDADNRKEYPVNFKGFS